jgi:hypothetical protein
MTTNYCINNTNKHQNKLRNSKIIASKLLAIYPIISSTPDTPDTNPKKPIYIPLPIWYHLTCPGDVAQLEERDNRTVEARGSSPLISTQLCHDSHDIPCKSQRLMV